MSSKLSIIIISLFLIFSCSNSKKDVVYEPSNKLNPYDLYKEGLDAFEINDYFFASKKFSEAELNFENIELAAKAAIMSSYSLYGISFYDQALENLERFLRTYPADKNIIYAHYLIAIIFFEQIEDEKKDLNPLKEANRKIDFFLKKYPNSDYAIDLKFKKNLIINQLAAKELYVAKYYISTQKWIPAINRLKVIVSDYDKTIFIEEALHRLVEIYFHIGLENEANKYAKILGYNYNSSEWFKQSYRILNRDYEFKLKRNNNKTNKKEKNFLKRIGEILK